MIQVQEEVFIFMVDNDNDDNNDDNNKHVENKRQLTRGVAETAQCRAVEAHSKS